MSLEVDIWWVHKNILKLSITQGEGIWLLGYHSLVGKWLFQNKLLGFWCRRCLRGVFWFLFPFFHKLLEVWDKRVVLSVMERIPINGDMVIGPQVEFFSFLGRGVVPSPLVGYPGWGFVGELDSPPSLLLGLFVISLLLSLIFRIWGVSDVQRLEWMRLLLHRMLD